MTEDIKMKNIKSTIISAIPIVLLIFSLIGAQFILIDESTGMADEIEEEPKMTNSIEIQTVNTGDFTMNYFKFGDGDKTLVILPGLSVQSVMGSADLVAGAYEQFTDDYTIYLFDRRNELPSSYTMYDMAHDTAKAIKVLGLGPVSIFGASQGGMMALEIASEYPDLVETMVLGSTTACVDDERYQLFGEWINLAKEGDAQGLYLAFGKALYSEEVFEASRQLLTDMAQTVTPDELRRFVVFAEATEGFNVLDKLDKITCPVLVLGSSDDQVLGGEASEIIADGLTNASSCEIYMYDGYGHAVYDTAPDYRDRMAQFLDANTGLR